MSSDKISKRLSDLCESLEDLKALLPGDPPRASEILSDAIKDLKDSLEEDLRRHIDLMDQAPVLIHDMDDRISLWSTALRRCTAGTLTRPSAKSHTTSWQPSSSAPWWRSNQSLWKQASGRESSRTSDAMEAGSMKPVIMDELSSVLKEVFL